MNTTTHDTTDASTPITLRERHELAALAASLRGLSAKLTRVAAEGVGLPRCEADVAALLDELAAAEADKKAHFEKFRAEYAIADAERSAECNASWERAWRRDQTAIAALTRFAVARREDAEAAATESAA